MRSRWIILFEARVRRLVAEHLGVGFDEESEPLAVRRDGFSAMSDTGAELVTLEDVLFVSNGLVPICEYKGRRFGVPFRVMEPGSGIRRPGDRGTLVLARAVAEWLKLL